MSDNWDFYFCQVDGEPASIFLDLVLVGQAPISSYGHMAYVRLKMLKPRPDGLSSQEEFETLKAVEDELTETISERCGAIYVGRNTSSGYRDFYFYAADPDRFSEAAEAAAARHSAYNCEVGTRADPAWSTYFHFLSPSKDERERMMNRRVRDALAERGDLLDQPRVIDHRAYFPIGHAAASFAQQIKRQGFEVQPPQVTDDGQYAIDFARTDLPDDMDEVAPRLMHLADEHSGKYDGWSCTVVQMRQG